MFGPKLSSVDFILASCIKSRLRSRIVGGLFNALVLRAKHSPSLNLQVNRFLSCTTLVILLAVFIGSSTSYAQKEFTISGSLRDSVSGEELIGASIFDLSTRSGATTNIYGFYSLTLPVGKHSLVYSYLGFNSDTFLIDLKENLTKTLALRSSAVQLKDVVIKAAKDNDRVSNTDIGVVKMNIKELNAVPVLFGEKDILNALTLMPGMSSAGEGNAGFFVRGGNVDQNLILLDEAPVYNPSHLLGFFSVFNSDAVKDVTLYKSGIPAEFGGRSSSVLDVHMRDGNLKKYGVSGGIGLISARLTAEGPIVKDKGSFIVTGRRTYLDLFIPLLSPDSKVRKVYFYDFNAKMNYRINDKHRLFLSGYYGHDVLSFGNNDINWGNGLGSLRWNWVINEKLFSNTTVAFSHYAAEKGHKSKKNNGYYLRSGIMDMNLKEDLNYYLNPNNTLRFGVHETFHIYSVNNLESRSINGTTSQLPKEAYANETAIYASNEQKISKRFNARYGIRLSMYNRLGPGASYTYNEYNLAIDSTRYQTLQNMVTYVGFEPRASLAYTVTPTIGLKASYQRMYQYTHLISNSTSSTPNDIWMPSSAIIKPQFSDQFSLSYFHDLLHGMLAISVEGYYKKLYNVIDYEDGADIVRHPNVESQLVFGSGRAYGAEFLIRKVKGKLTGWVAYTLSRTERKIDGINQGSYYPARQDRTHDLAIVISYRPTKRWSVSANWVYYTGNAVTFPVGYYTFNNQVIPYFTSKNGYRMPDYHRLDLGVTLHGKENKKFRSDWTLSIYNVYSRLNAYSISYQESSTKPGTVEAVKFSLFPIVPSINWSFQF